MRISDWSSDVCSSDLIEINALDRDVRALHGTEVRVRLAQLRIHAQALTGLGGRTQLAAVAQARSVILVGLAAMPFPLRRLGKNLFDIQRKTLRTDLGRIGIGRQCVTDVGDDKSRRSEEHTSEPQQLM